MFPVKLSLVSAQGGSGGENSLAKIAGMPNTRDVDALNVAAQATLLSLLFSTQGAGPESFAPSHQGHYPRVQLFSRNCSLLNIISRFFYFQQIVIFNLLARIGAGGFQGGSHLFSVSLPDWDTH